MSIHEDAASLLPQSPSWKSELVSVSLQSHSLFEIRTGMPA